MSALKQIKNLTEQIFKPKRLNTVVFFVTSICNEKCRHCFYWEELNQKGDLTFEQIRRISETMPAISDLWLSGGEPFMRRELAEILELFYRNNDIRSVNLPTNGLFAERAHRCLDRVLTNCPGLHIDLNVSVDGFEATHEKLRGVPGCYQKTLEMIRSLPPLVEKHRNQLRVNMNTCLNADNADELIDFMKFVYEKLPMDGQYLQLIRGSVMDASLKQIPLEKLREIYAYARWLYDRYAERMFKSLPCVSREALKVAYSGTLAFHNKIQYANYLQSTRWPMACTAGETFCVIDYNGDVRACELRGKLANLKDYDFDFSRFWADTIRQRETRQIICDQCWCTHVCNIHDSARYSPRALAVDIPFTYLESRPSRPQDFAPLGSALPPD
jgi:MoaA/NifB/PqqE/SkfB family radical SAM enzyme